MMFNSIQIKHSHAEHYTLFKSVSGFGSRSFHSVVETSGQRRGNTQEASAQIQGRSSYNVSVAYVISIDWPGLVYGL